MTPIKPTPIVRRGTEALGYAFGPDRNRRLVISLQAIGDEDYIRLRPHGTRRSELVRLIDVYRFALRCRVNRELLEKARAKKEKKAAQRAARRIDRAHKRLFRPE
jgi:predicted component of type VI protein secretion system